MLSIIYGDIKNSIYNTNVYKIKIPMNLSGLNQIWPGK